MCNIVYYCGSCFLTVARTTIIYTLYLLYTPYICIITCKLQFRKGMHMGYTKGAMCTVAHVLTGGPVDCS